MTSRRKTRSNARRPLVRTEENTLLRDLDPESAKWLRDLRGKERRQGVVPPATYTPYEPLNLHFAPARRAGRISRGALVSAALVSV